MGDDVIVYVLEIAELLVEMARAKGVEMPISAAVAAILDGKVSVGDAIEGLLTRPFRSEG
jgi:glycerol-3-phosphate dehydrogenase (NAD(P)+)